MEESKLKLDEAAKVIGCHPRTVLRAMTGEPNPYWAEGHNPELSVETLAEAFDCGLAVMKRCVDGRDEFLRPERACELLKVIPRTFRYRRYVPAIRKNRTVRYSELQIKKEQWEYFPDEAERGFSW
jgi:hypothetical protein